jgi:hypothetical protein
MKEKTRKKRSRIDWKKNVDEATAWVEECQKIGITPTTTQLQNHFGWTQTVASKVKSFIGIMNSKEQKKDA